MLLRLWRRGIFTTAPSYACRNAQHFLCSDPACRIAATVTTAIALTDIAATATTLGRR